MSTNSSLLNRRDILATATAAGAFGLLVEQIHAAKNVGNVNAAELATYIVEKGKPLLSLVR